MYQALILIGMIFCHITDDYYLQGLLASLKQKAWWADNAPEPLYRYDYIVALFMHSFSWSFMIMLIPTVYTVLTRGTWYPFLFVGNIAVHMAIDNAKANKRSISLLQDQSMHMVQILVTWLFMIVL